MPVTALPASLKIVELRLAIQLAGEHPRRVGNKSRMPSAPLAEIWRGSVTFAALSQSDLMQAIAKLEAYDGRATAFGLPLKQGFATHTNSVSGTLAATTTRGKDTIAVTCSTLTEITAGTLLQIGTAGDAGAQLVEVLEDVTVTTATLVRIAPRIRTAIASGTAVTGGNITAAFKRVGDKIDSSFATDSGMLTLEFVEAL